MNIKEQTIAITVGKKTRRGWIEELAFGDRTGLSIGIYLHPPGDEPRGLFFTSLPISFSGDKPRCKIEKISPAEVEITDDWGMPASLTSTPSVIEFLLSQATEKGIPVHEPV